MNYVKASSSSGFIEVVYRVNDSPNHPMSEINPSDQFWDVIETSQRKEGAGSGKWEKSTPTGSGTNALTNSPLPTIPSIVGWTVGGRWGLLKVHSHSCCFVLISVP